MGEKNNIILISPCISFASFLAENHTSTGSEITVVFLLALSLFLFLPHFMASWTKQLKLFFNVIIYPSWATTSSRWRGLCVSMIPGAQLSGALCPWYGLPRQTGPGGGNSQSVAQKTPRNMDVTESPWPGHGLPGPLLLEAGLRARHDGKPLVVGPLHMGGVRSQLRWFGHLARIPPGHLPGEVFRARPMGRRPPGRPRTRWRVYVSRLPWERLRARRKCWIKWLGRGKSGLPCSGCCTRDQTDKQWTVDGWMDWSMVII